MQEIQNKKMIIRIGRNTLSFTMLDPTDKRNPVSYEPYVVKGGISMAANLREAFKTATLTAIPSRRVQVLLDTPTMLVPIEQFEEEEINDLYNYTFSPSEEPRRMLFNVLPDLKAVCIFPINKDLHMVVSDHYEDAQYIHVMTPVWRHLHQRSYTGHYNKLYACFQNGQLYLSAFQQNRFRFCNSFEASHANDALYFMVYVWKQLRMDTTHDELHIVGEIPEQEQLLRELRQCLQKVYVVNPAVDLNQATVTTVKGMPYDLMTLLVKGR